MGRLFRLVLAGLSAVVVVATVAAAVVVVQFVQFQDQPVLEEEETKTLVIPSGTSWPGVVERVEEAGLVESALFFDIWGRRSGLSNEVRAGTFYLEGPLLLEEMADVLRKGGRADELVITFQEGLTIFEMADRVAEAGLVDREEFLREARRADRYDWASPQMESLEGYLFPDTYRFNLGTSAEDIVDRLVGRFDREASIFEEYADQKEAIRQEFGLDRHEIVILASLIERETGVDHERSLIARVFYNRLERGMLLQTDPTCVYGEATYDQVPTPSLCRDPLNRYSTYVVEGLPPGPIASPGRASLKAALMPSEDPQAQEYLYFVSRRDGTGEHYFSTNYAEHRQAIDRFLRQ